MVEALELTGPLKGQDVEGLFDDTQPALVPDGIAADRAERRVADVETALAEDDLIPNGDKGGRQLPRLRIGGAEEVEGQPLGGLGSDPRRS